MLVDQSLITEFDFAKDALLAGLRASCDSCPILHGPGGYESAPTHSLGLVNTIEKTQQRLQQVQMELERTQSYLLKLRAHALNSSSPCGALPVELLCEIFSYAVGDKGNYDVIFSIASVCNLWRAVVLDMSPLFVQADWDRWPTWLLETWCTRANGRPFIVKLGELAVSRVLQQRQSDYNRLLESTRAAWEILEIQMGHIGSQRDALADVVFNDDLVSLRRLRLSLPRSYSQASASVLHIKAKLPVLQEVHLDGVAISLTTPSTKLRHATINLSTMLSWSDWTQIIHPLPGITTLVLTNIRSANLARRFRLELPDLVDLRLESSSSDGTVANLLRSLHLPNVRKVTLQDIIYYADSDVTSALAQCAPQLTSLTMVEVDNNWLGSAAHQLEALNRRDDGGLLIPSLKQLSLLRKNPAPLEATMNVRLENLLREFVGVRRELNLTIPAMFVSPVFEKELRALIGPSMLIV